MARIAFVSTVVGSLAFPGVALGSDFEHVLLVVFDDVGTDKIGAYASDVDNPRETRPDTATIDMIASAGVRFSDAWATPYCSPTRATLFTGEYPYRTRIGANIEEGSTSRLSSSTMNIMKLAVENGLETALFGKWHLGETTRTPDTDGTVVGLKDYPVTLGFNTFKGNTDSMLESYTNWLYMVSAPVGRTTRYNTTATTSTEFASGVTTDDAVSWMVSKASSRRLTVAAYHLPHFTLDGTSLSWEDGAIACGATTGNAVDNMNSMTECADAELATLLAGTPDLETTLVIFMGDNGSPKQVTEGNFDDGRGKGTPYESGVRVPLIVADGAAVQDALDNGGVLPDGGTYLLDTGTVVSDPSSVVDVLATVADLLSLTTSTCTLGSTCGRDSVSLRSALTGGTPDRTSTWTETYSRTGSSYRGTAAVRSGDFKLIINVASSCRAYEMYDLATDRWEATDLYGDAAYATEQDELLALVADHEAAMTVAWLPAADCS